MAIKEIERLLAASENAKEKAQRLVKALESAERALRGMMTDSEGNTPSEYRKVPAYRKKRQTELVRLENLSRFYVLSGTKEAVFICESVFIPYISVDSHKCVHAIHLDDFHKAVCRYKGKEWCNNFPDSATEDPFKDYLFD